MALVVMSNCEVVTFPLVSWVRWLLDCIDSRYLPSFLFSTEEPYCIQNGKNSKEESHCVQYYQTLQNNPFGFLIDKPVQKKTKVFIKVKHLNRNPL